MNDDAKTKFKTKYGDFGCLRYVVGGGEARCCVVWIFNF